MQAIYQELGLIDVLFLITDLKNAHPLGLPDEFSRLVCHRSISIPFPGTREENVNHTYSNRTIRARVRAHFEFGVERRVFILTVEIAQHFVLVTLWRWRGHRCSLGTTSSMAVAGARTASPTKISTAAPAAPTPATTPSIGRHHGPNQGRVPTAGLSPNGSAKFVGSFLT